MTTSNILRAFTLLLDQDDLDLRLNKLLERTVLRTEEYDNGIKYIFKNGVEVGVFHSFDGFRLKLSDPSFYDSGDSNDKLMSEDRVKYYLKSLANYKYQ